MRSTPVVLLVGACLALGALPVPASGAELPAPQLLADLVPGVSQVALSQAPQPLVAIGSRMLFTAEPATGRDLWSSDATPHGAERLFTGAGGQGYVAWEQAGAIELLVEPTDYTEGPALFRTDGTAAGTQLVASWPSAVFMGWLGTSGQRSWFAPCRALSDAYQCELWTVAGAERSATLLAADVGWYHAGLQRQPVAGGRLFFFTGQDQDPDPDPDRDLELWRSDGTTSSTVRLHAWPPTAAARWLGRRGAEAFFSLQAGGGWEIWKSDGTPRGTRMLRRLRTAEPYLIDFEDDEPRTGPLFFCTYEPATRTTELWAITGGAKVRDLGPFRTVREPQRVVDAAGNARYLFAATRRNPSPADLHRMRLWVTDGTPGNTAELRGPGGAPVLVERPLGIAAGRYYFAGTDGSPDVEPWVTDGTTAGTRRLADTCPGLCGSELGGVVAVGQTVLFVSELAFEQTLWRSDGTSAVPVTTLAGGNVDLGSEAWSVPLGRVAGGRLFFAVKRGGGFELWASDGTTAGTTRVDSGFTAPLGSAPVPLAVSAQTLLFDAADPLDFDRRRVYLQRRGEAVGNGVRLPEYVVPTAGVVDDARRLALFVATDGDYRSQLWVTDGTAGGTVQLTAFGLSLRAGAKYHDECYDSVELPQRSGDRWYFVADVCAGGKQLWSTDGSLAGTHLTTLLPDDAFMPVQVGDELFFLAPVAADDGAVVPQLFRIALAGGERVQLTRRAGGFHALAQYWAAPSLGRLFFTVADAGESELWVSDGTAAGTGGFALAPDGAPLAGVREVAAGPGFAIAWTGQFGELERSVFGIALATRLATRLADMPVRDVYAPLEWASSPAGVVFAGNDPLHGEEPWISDGTLAGTRVLDVAPGPTSSRPHAFAASDAGVFFAARTVETGEELWIADGVGAGARLVDDLAPGRDSSSPSRLVAGPGRLLFAADDGASGNEPWVLEWSATSAAATADGGEP